MASFWASGRNSIGVMRLGELLVDSFGRIRDGVHHAVDGLSAEQLGWRPGAEANSIAWTVWHLARVQDDHVAYVAGLAQVWTEQGFHGGFGLPFEPGDIGFGHEADEVAAVSGLTAAQLTGYLDAVHEQSVAFVGGLTEADLDTVVDMRWDPPVTLGVRLVSVLNDDTQHVGQAAYVRGLLLAQDA